MDGASGLATRLSLERSEEGGSMKFRRLLGLQWDRTAAAVCAVAAVVVLAVGWIQISGTPYPAEQLPYILSAGVGGLLLVGFAATLWLSADRRDEWGELASIDEVLHRLAGDAAFDPASVVGSPNSPEAAER